MSKYCKSDDTNCGCITWMENGRGPGQPFMMGRFKPGHEPDGWLIFDKHHFMPPPTLNPEKMAELFRIQREIRESRALRIKNWGTADPPIVMGGDMERRNLTGYISRIEREQMYGEEHD